MADACSRRCAGARDGGAGDTPGHRAHPPAPVREAELPLRERRGAPRVGGAQLLQGEPDALRDAPGRGDRARSPGDRSLPSGQGGARGGGGGGPRRADRQPATASAGLSSKDAFSRSDALFLGLVGLLGDTEAAGLTHSELEARLDHDGRELLRQLFQDHLDLRARTEERANDVVDVNDTRHAATEPGHHRPLTTIFGAVTVTRLAYRAVGAENLHLADAALNLPREHHSHGLRERSAIEATRGSYDEARDAILRATGQSLGKRQLEELTRRTSTDVEDFYDETAREPADPTDTLVISADGKGIVMRPDALRPQTKRAAASSEHKLATRLSKGEKKNRKRMAELAVVYDSSPVVRVPTDVLASSEEGTKPEAPVAKAKWLVASIVDDAREVIAAAFCEAERRDPAHLRAWVALVDGAKHQIDVIATEARRRGIEVTIVVDFVHVIEYLWSAAWCFFSEGDPAVEEWVGDKALAVLSGKAGTVAGAIRRKATYLGLDTGRRKKADECATYLKNKAPYLDYPSALAKGWPIATGVIEGACRHLVRDRFDITGARWSLDGAEAMLKLRAVRANGDWSEYWNYHLAQEHQRVHVSRYAGRIVPVAA
jgi:hypothetical protein